MNLKTAKKAFWIGFPVTLAIVPLVARTISFGTIVFLPLGTEVVLK